MILYEKTYEREGNDSWLIDRIQIVKDSFGLSINHKWKWNGWQGEDKGSKDIELDLDDIKASQKKINEYIDEHSLYHEWPNGDVEGIKIDLKELLTKE